MVLLSAAVWAVHRRQQLGGPREEGGWVGDCISGLGQRYPSKITSFQDHWGGGGFKWSGCNVRLRLWLRLPHGGGAGGG